MNIAQALGDESRVRILMALRGNELCVCQIIALFNLAPSTISKHLSILHQAFLIEKSKRGRWIYYRRCESNSSRLCNQAFEWIDDTLLDDKTIIADQAKLAKILAMEPEELCKK